LSVPEPTAISASAASVRARSWSTMARSARGASSTTVSIAAIFASACATRRPSASKVLRSLTTARR
jgi:hypothetical protein